MPNNHHIKSKVAAGAVLVALSGVVPQPFVQDAKAASVVINVTGKFISGITLTKVADIQMKTIVATGKTGNVGFDEDAAQTVKSGTFIGTPVVGKIKMKAAAVQDVDITVSGMGKFAVTTGSATLSKIALGNGPIAVPQVLSAGTKTTAKVAGVSLTATADATAGKSIALGATVAWAGAKPIGAFTRPLTFTIAY